MNLIEQLRSLSLRHTMGRATMVKNWDLRKDIFLGHIQGEVTPRALVDFGDFLSNAFQSQGQGDRTQGALSGGGYVWSALITWFLNLGYMGTEAIAFCGSSFVPKSIQDAVSVNYNNTSVGSDMDVVVIGMPGVNEQPAARSRAAMKRAVNDYCEEQFGELAVTIIQCKTNWNDNAQVPMLWNLLFKQARRGVIPENGYTFGRNNYNLRNFRHFSYAFVTVPTSGGGPDGFDPQKLPALRVQGMTGGAYWGFPSKRGVCRSIKEFFNHQYGIAGGVMPNVDDVGKAYCDNLNPRSDDYDIGAFGLH